MSNIEKIKAEIERLENMDYPCDTSEQATGFYNALDRISAFIDSLPEETPSKDLEEEVKNYFEGLWPGTETAEQCNTDLHFTPLAIMRLARHFAEWGAKCKDSLQVQETCKENQDSFTDEPKELEEAADEYEDWVESYSQADFPTCVSFKQAFIAGAKWMESQMPMPEDTVIFMKGVEEGRRLEREDRNDDNLPRFYGD